MLPTASQPPLPQRGPTPPWPYAPFCRGSTTLGRGSTARIYPAIDRLGMRTVLKVIENKAPNDRKARTEVACLAEMAASPLIVDMYDAWQADREFVIALEWCRGGSVQQALDARPAWIGHEERARHIMHSVFAGLAHLHSRAIVHRDIKPGNVLLLEEMHDHAYAPRIKLADLGSAHRMPSLHHEEVDVPSIVGTVPFMSPECLTLRAGPKSDVWSAGVMACTLLTGGIMPFADRTNAAQPSMQGVWRSILHDEPRWAHPAWNGVSEEAIDFCRACLVKPMGARLSAEEALRHPWLEAQGGWCS